MKVGYRRVSSIEQNFDRQDLGDVERVFEEKQSGGTADRRALQEMIAFVRFNDEVIVYSIDRLARNLRDLQGIIQELNDKGVTVSFISEGLSFKSDSNDAFAKLQLQMLGAFSEYERNIIRIRQAEGIAKAKLKGIYSGRKRSINADKIKELHLSGVTPTVIAQRMGCSRQSVYRSLA
jgi:DNA invertase Pin-like site-specific DNA recombinase